jgi:hypothetical protein
MQEGFHSNSVLKEAALDKEFSPIKEVRKKYKKDQDDDVLRLASD